MERGGYFSTASMLWSNAANFPCKPLNREWRLNRSHSCSSLADLRPEPEVTE
ncbi:TPA: ANR family transcriptional regulator [Kluyvera ascorbata]